MGDSFVPSGFFAFRTPLLPIDELLAWGADLTAARADAAEAGDEALNEALEIDRRALRARLKAVVARPEVREALFLASPTLDENLHYWENTPDDERGRKV